MNETGDDRMLAVYFSGLNAVTFDRVDEPTADAEGHVLTGTVLRREGPAVPDMVPLRVRVAHGVSPNTATTMLRKLADMIDQDASILSAVPGSAVRRMPDGSVVRKRITPESLMQLAESLSEDERQRLLDNLDRIRLELTDEQPPEPRQD
ncbi:MAG: hypothetical protein AAFP26_08645 [Planctomycetota bacterium]